MEEFDYLIIGAGPTGSFLAEKLANKGFKVGLFDKKKIIGKPVQCTGLLTNEITKFVDINNDFLINETFKLKINSKNESATINSHEYVVDRFKFDNYLLKKAKEAKAKIFLNNEFKGFKKNKLIFSKKSFKSKKIIGCDGPNSAVNKEFKINKNLNFFLGKQFVIKSKFFEKNSYETYFEEEFNDFFAWKVPISKKIVRIGVASTNMKSVNDKLDFLIKSKKIKGKIIEINAGLIPIFNPFNSNYKKINNLSVYLLGDAGGIVKATTGGGIIPSFKSINDSLNSIIKNKPINLLKTKAELITHLLIHNKISKFNDKKYDELIKELKKNEIKKIISSINRDNALKLGFKTISKNPNLIRFIF